MTPEELAAIKDRNEGRLTNPYATNKADVDALVAEVERLLVVVAKVEALCEDPFSHADTGRGGIAAVPVYYLRDALAEQAGGGECDCGHGGLDHQALLAGLGHCLIGRWTNKPCPCIKFTGGES